MHAYCTHCTGPSLTKHAYDRSLRAEMLSCVQEKLRKLKSAQILRSLAQKTSFGCAAVEVVSMQMMGHLLMDLLFF